MGSRLDEEVANFRIVSVPSTNTAKSTNIVAAINQIFISIKSQIFGDHYELIRQNDGRR